MQRLLSETSTLDVLLATDPGLGASYRAFLFSLEIIKNQNDKELVMENSYIL